MRAIIRRIVNSIIWIVCGILVIVIRAFLLQGSNILVWEILGGIMIGYGTARLVWALAKAAQTVV